ncbi:MAG: hypothetical protein WAV11_02745 [Minisyncoccia bacterium]
MRVIAGTFLFLSVFLAPWWLTVILAIIGLFLFDNYLEAVIAVIFLDVLYNTYPALSFSAWKFSLLFLLLFILIKPLKSRLKFYSFDN